MKAKHKHNASIILRVFIRLQQQIENASREQRVEDMKLLCRIFGAAEYLCYGCSRVTPLEVKS